jgi:biofilm PGA synthesis protein PgaD
LGVYCSVIIVMGGSLVAWATYNLVRFRGPSRRASRSVVDLAALAAYHSVEPKALAMWQQARHLMLDHDDNGSIAAVTVLNP